MPHPSLERCAAGWGELPDLPERPSALGRPTQAVANPEEGEVQRNRALDAAGSERPLKRHRAGAGLKLAAALRKLRGVSALMQALGHNFALARAQLALLMALAQNTALIERSETLHGASRGCRQRSVVPSARASVRNLTLPCHPRIIRHRVRARTISPWPGSLATPMRR
jgi:hypothetical protein